MTQPANDTRPPEPHAIRIKRLTLRSWRRGIKEMDLILGRFADGEMATMTPEDMDAYEVMMEENDWDLYYWVTGARPMPETYAPLLQRIAAFHDIARR